MKNIKILILTTGLFAASFALAAKNPEQAYVESYRGRPDTPVPIAVLAPLVDDEYAGATVVLDFVVDANGLPTDIAPRESYPAGLVASVVNAVARWKFTPLQRNGVPVATKVVLPVRIVGVTDTGDTIAGR
jgi:TonB family protein